MKHVFALLFLLFGIPSFFSQTVYRNYVDGQLYLKLSDAAPKQIYRADPNHVPVSVLGEAGKILYKYGVTKITRTFHQASDDANLPKILRVYFSNANDVDALMHELKNVKEIEYAEKVPLTKTDALPNDPNFPAHLNQINAQNAWNVFNGNSNITVAIVDNAVMWTHADLSANTYTNPGEIANNGIDDDGNGYIDDVNGWDAADLDNNTVPTNSLMSHGTHCAGIAGARTDNNLGVASIGWNLKIIPVKCQTDNGSTTTVAYGYEGIIYAAKTKARVISCSWGGPGYSSVEQLAVDYAWNKGCIVIASAGNSSTNTPNYPGAYNHVYCVASVDNADVKSSFSNYGTWADIAAPGENVLSTIPYTGTATYQSFSGTSMATPLVAGLAGLMLSKTPYMTQVDVLNCISNTAVNIYTLSGNASYSVNSQLGAGRIEAYQAMLCAASFSTVPPVANFYANPVVSCPNTPVVFYDSSLYQPTSWSWVFQNGIPATSTLSNPSVQWATSGTYSVSLTVTNANGSNAKVKQSYVSIANPINLPFVEGFQATQFLPPNWTANNIDNDNVFWQRTTSVGGFGTSTACALFDNYSMDAAGERDEMISPKFIFSNVSSARLRFDVAYARYNATFCDSLEVKLSTNCGVSWTSIYLKGSSLLATAPDVTSQFIPSSSQWRRDTIDISALTAGQGNVMFSFVNRGHFGQSLYVDNINLVFPTPTLSIASPSNVCAGATVNFTNTSLAAASYTWNFGGNSSPATSTVANPAVSYSLAGIYTVTLIGANNTTTATVTKTINVLSLTPPSVSLTASSASVCSGNSVTLTASGASSYTWSTGAQTATTSVVPTASLTVYTATASNNNACFSAVSSISISVVPTATLSTSNNQTVCAGNNLTLTANGATNYSWSTGSTNSVIVVSPITNTMYVVTGDNSGCANSKTISVTVNALTTSSLTASSTSVCSGNSVALTASGASSYTWSTGAQTATISVAPTASLTVYTATASNNNACPSVVSSLSISMIVTPALSVSGNQTICSGNSASFSVNGASSYSWNTGATASNIVVSPTTATSYTVVGYNSACATSQTMNVSVDTPVSPLLSSSSASICNGASATLTAGGANSYTWNTGAQTSSITVSPSNSLALYTATASNNNACPTASASITISVVALPNISIIASTNAVCVGFTSTLNAYGANSYTWSTGAISQSLAASPTVNTTYTVLGETADCVGSATHAIAIMPPFTITISATSPTVYCGQCATLTANGSVGNYTWFPYNSLTYSVGPFTKVCPLITTTYTVESITSVCSGSAAITITVLPIPTLTLSASNPTVQCGHDVTITVSGGTGNYVWINPFIGINSPVIVNPSVTTSYSVQSSSSSIPQCSVGGAITVSVVPLVPLITVTNSPCNNLCTGVANISGLNNTPYSFTLTNSNCSVLPCANLCDGTYTFFTHDNYGCNSETSFSVACTSTTGVKSYSTEEALQIYPNPAKDELHIDFAGSFDYVLYNSLGQVLVSEKNISDKVIIDASRFARGIYLIEVKNAGMNLRKKVLVAE